MSKTIKGKAADVAKEIKAEVRVIFSSLANAMEDEMSLENANKLKGTSDFLSRYIDTYHKQVQVYAAFDGP